jgi:hypothetical protein
MVARIDESFFSLLDEPELMWIGDKPQNEVTDEKPESKPVETPALDNWSKNHAGHQTSKMLLFSVGVFATALTIAILSFV